MGLTINPAVSGGRRTWMGHVASFWLGGCLGALAASAMTLLAYEGLPTAFSEALAGGLFIAVLPVAILADLRIGVQLPYRHRQVPESWRRTFPLAVVALSYGAILGFGFATLFTSSAHVAMLASLPRLGSLGVILVAAALFATGKTLVLLAPAKSRSVDEVSSCYVTKGRDIWILRLTTASLTFVVGLALFFDTLGR